MPTPTLQQLLLSAALCLAPFAHAAREADPVALGPDFKPAEMSPKLLKASDLAAFKTLQRAAISSFQVEFVTKGSATATAREFGKSGSANTSMSVALTGVAEPDFQAITNQLHADFVRDLQAIGIEVLPTARVLAAPAYQKMAASGGPSPYRKSGGGQTSVVMAPDGLAVYGMGQALGGKSSLFGALSAMASVGTMAGAISGGIDLQKELDVSLIQVRLTLDFVDLSSSSSSFWGRMSGEASVGATVKPTIIAGAMLSVQNASTGGTLTLQAPLTVQGDAIRELKDVTSTGGAVALALFAAAIGQSASASEKEAVAEPESYRAAVGAGFGSLREMMMDQIKRAR